MATCTSAWATAAAPAIRSIERAREHWQRVDDGHACECLIRAQQIMAELLGGLLVRQLGHDDQQERLAQVGLFGLEVSHQFVQDNQVHVLEPLALDQIPVLIPAFLQTPR